MNGCRRAQSYESLIQLRMGLFLLYGELKYMTKPFKTIDEQLEILKDRNLVIDDELLARQSLSFYGYYEIVNGYKQFLLNTQAESERFTDGETFSHLLSLYQLDKEFRNGIMEATLEIELVLRTAIAYVIAEQFGELQSDYLKPKNYMRGKKREGSTRYPLHQLFDKFDKIINDDLEPYKHYRDYHGNIPPWILLKGTTFGNLVTFYKLLKPAEKISVISICFGLESRFITESVKNMFSQSLNLIHSYRNRAAHSGRIFSYKSKKFMEYNEIFHEFMGVSSSDYNNGKGKTGLYTLMAALGLFKNSRANFLLEFSIYYNSKKHCEIYPNDLLLLCHETEIELDIFEKNIAKYE